MTAVPSYMINMRTGTYPVVAWRSGRSFRLRKRISYRNSFQTILTVSLVAEGNQTRARCRTGLHPFCIVFLAVWFGGIGYSEYAVFESVLDHAYVGAAAPTIPAMLAALGAGLVYFGRWISRDEGDFLVEWVRNSLDAKRAS